MPSSLSLLPRVLIQKNPIRPGFLAVRLFVLFCLFLAGPETECSLLYLRPPRQTTRETTGTNALKASGVPKRKLACFSMTVRLLPMRAAEDGLTGFKSRAARAGGG